VNVVSSINPQEETIARKKEPNFVQTRFQARNEVKEIRQSHGIA
jgi:hypothetical protein